MSDRRRPFERACLTASTVPEIAAVALSTPAITCTIVSRCAVAFDGGACISVRTTASPTTTTKQQTAMTSAARAAFQKLRRATMRLACSARR